MKNKLFALFILFFTLIAFFSYPINANSKTTTINVAGKSPSNIIKYLKSQKILKTKNIQIKKENYTLQYINKSEYFITKKSNNNTVYFIEISSIIGADKSFEEIKNENTQNIIKIYNKKHSKYYKVIYDFKLSLNKNDKTRYFMEVSTKNIDEKGNLIEQKTVNNNIFKTINPKVCDDNCK